MKLETTVHFDGFKQSGNDSFLMLNVNSWAKKMKLRNWIKNEKLKDEKERKKENPFLSWKKTAFEKIERTLR